MPWIGGTFFRFSSPEEFTATLQRAGFSGVDVRTLPLTWRLSSPEGAFDAVSRGGVRTSALLRAQTPEALDAIRAAVRRGVEGYAKDGLFLLPMPAVLASAERL